MTLPLQPRLLTPPKITAWLDCAHYLTLQHEVERKEREIPFGPFGELAQLLRDKGLAHEQAVLDRYRADGKSVFEVPARNEKESFERWVQRVGNPLDGLHDVIFQMPFIYAGIRGVADFLVKAEHPTDGSFTYEPVDAKLTRNEAKPGHVLQLCFYADAVAALTGTSPEFVHLELGSGKRETIRVADVVSYWRRLHGQLAGVFGDDALVGVTVPERCGHCEFCEFQPACDAEWRASDSLIFVADIRKADRQLLTTNGTGTMAALALLAQPVESLDATRQARLVGQSALQIVAREAHPDLPPPFKLVAVEPPADDDTTVAEPTGFAALPAPDAGDVFLDFEGHPFWKPDAELFFLFGWVQHDDGDWTFRDVWAHDLAEEAEAGSTPRWWSRRGSATDRERMTPRSTRSLAIG